MITRNPKSFIFTYLGHVYKMALQMTIFEIPGPIQRPKLFVELEVPTIGPTYLPFKSHQHVHPGTKMYPGRKECLYVL